MSKFKPNQKTTAILADRSGAATLNRAKDMSVRAPAVSIPDLPRPTGVAVEPNAFGSLAFQTAVSNSTRKLALYCTLVFLYFRFSFLHEYLVARHGLQVHVLLILGAVCYLACVLSGTAFTGLKYKAVLMWLLFGMCMCLATLTSSWPGGSVAVLLPYLRTTLPLILVIPAVAYTSKDIQKVVDTIGLAGATTIIIGFFDSDFRSGRLGMDTTGGSIQDPNDFAAHMLLVVPAVAYLTMRSGRNYFVKLIGVCIIGAAFYEFLSTGSRGGLVGLIVTGLYIFKKGSPRLRAGLLFGIPLLCAFALPFVPGESTQRLKSLFDSKDATEEAADSQNARTILLQESLKITFHHPLLGIGPGEFEDYQSGLAVAKGERGLWHATHNGYTQVSSECGIPAAIFYVAGMFLAFRSLRRSKKANVPRVSAMAQTLSTSMVGFSASICFLSQGYSFALLVLTGIALSIERLLEESAAP